MAVSKVEVAQRLERLVEACRRNAMKITHQRMEVFRELAGTDEHPDAETIYQNVRKRVPGLSRDTVYRTLSSLENQGLVRKAEMVFGSGRYDANMERHHHFVCTECGAVHDFYSEAMNDLPIPRDVASLGRVESSHVQLRGTCSVCTRRGHRSG
jgi:Fur family peroxide stress response transcriptional regulator